jgi:hypothetical protein
MRECKDFRRSERHTRQKRLSTTAQHFLSYPPIWTWQFYTPPQSSIYIPRLVFSLMTGVKHWCISSAWDMLVPWCCRSCSVLPPHVHHTCSWVPGPDTGCSSMPQERNRTPACSSAQEIQAHPPVQTEHDSWDLYGKPTTCVNKSFN